MRLKIRYSCVFLILLYIFIYVFYMRKDSSIPFNENFLNDILNELDIPKSILLENSKKSFFCESKNCFNYNKCDEFLVYIYPKQGFIYPIYNGILEALNYSQYITHDPDKACIYIPSLDTLDRDILSKHYIKITKNEIGEHVPFWNNGTNHLIFNLYSGTYPQYTEKLDFDHGNAMLISANIKTFEHHHNFDLTLPLVTEHFVQAHFNRTKNPVFSSNKKYLAAFKGKRYLYGHGSETRNSLYHMHNGDDLVFLTTCKHGDWKLFKDDRCESDNQEYEKYDYTDLLVNSVFCLVPRGRRLASYRFLEVLNAGCIPIILSNDWLLPFAEVIDWSQAAIVFDEKNIFVLTDFLYSFTETEITRMRAQVYTIYNNYFSSFRKIMDTILEILKDRVSPSKVRPPKVWNSFPGALNVDYEFSTDMRDFPFYSKTLKNFKFKDKYVVSIYVTSQDINHINSNLARLLNQCSISKQIYQVIVIWNSYISPPNVFDNPNNISLKIFIPPNGAKGLSKFYYNAQLYSSVDAIFTLNENETVTYEELDLAFTVWKTKPDTLVGFRAYSHRKTHDLDGTSNTESTYELDLKSAKNYSLLATTSCIYHKYYSYLFNKRLTFATHAIMAYYTSQKSFSYFVEDLAFNFLISSITRRPPIKIGERQFLNFDVNLESDLFLKNIMGKGDNFSYNINPVEWTNHQETLLKLAFSDFLLYTDEAHSFYRNNPGIKEHDLAQFGTHSKNNANIPTSDFPDFPLQHSPIKSS